MIRRPPRSPLFPYTPLSRSAKMREFNAMTTVTSPPIDAPRLSPATAADLAPPVARPKTSVFKMIREVLDHGGPGYLQFAITNICNAKCDFCGFAVDRFDPKQRRSVTLAEACDAIDICVRNHIGYLL